MTVGAYFKVSHPYPEVPPFTWPEPGVRTWTPPEKSYFGPCTGASSCEGRSACPVGVITTLGGGPHGCDCPCHDEQREKAASRKPEPRPAVPWWDEIRERPEWKRGAFG